MNEIRIIERQPANGAIEYSYKGANYAARLSDMTREGCRLSMSGAIPGVGDALDLTLMEDLVVTGRVMWSVDDVAGLLFEKPVVDAVVRYFSFSMGHPIELDVTMDGFGRTLPPLGQDGSRR